MVYSASLSGGCVHWGTAVWLQQESEGSSSCAVFPTLAEALFNLGQVLFPVKPTKLLQDPIRFYDSCEMDPMLRDSFTDVTKEINPVAVVCPTFCFLWKVKWKWNNQTWIPSQNPDFPGKIWFSCLSSTFNGVFCPGWDCGRLGWISPWFSLPFLPCLCNSCREGLTHGPFIQWLFNKTQEYISRAGIAEERTSCTF